MSDVPQNWSREMLKRHVRFAYGESLASENRNDGDVPVFGSNGVVGTHDRSITHAPAIVIGRKGSSGKVTWSDIPCFPIDTTYFVDRTQTREDMRWLFYALESLELDKINFDSAVPGLSRELAYSLPLFFPPLPEQQRIAAYLDASCSAIDAAVAAKRRQLETLDSLHKTIIHHAITQGLNPAVEMKKTDVEWLLTVPKHWRIVRVKDVLEFQNTIRVPLSAAERGLMTTKTYDYYGASGVIDKVDDYLFDGTYILIAEDGANLLTRSKPLAFLASGKFWVNNHAHILKPRWGGDNTFFVSLLEAQDYSLFVTGAAQPKLTMENLGRYKIVVPPLAEQQTIAVFLHKKNTEFNTLSSQIERQISTLTAYRKSLIHECITCQRRVTEADVARARRGRREAK